MTSEELSRQLERKLTGDQYRALRYALMRLSAKTSFAALFPLAANLLRPGHVWSQAAHLLVDVEPECPLSCDDALHLLASYCWQVSDQLVPFYFVTQFGKREVREAVARVAADIHDSEQRRRVETVAYWINEAPAVELLGVTSSRGMIRQWDA
jgi:hypothetical protein